MNQNPTAGTGVALITGASSGIGLELARVFARNGHSLILVARSEDLLAQVATNISTEHGVHVETIPCDLTLHDERERLFQEVQASGYTVDILVNNAGEGAFGRFHEIEYERLQYIVDLNITAVMHLTHLFLPSMLLRGFGRVLNTASIAGFEPGPLLQVYHATKAFVLYLTEALAWEYEKEGIHFTALAPGATDTDFFLKADMTESPMADKDQLADPAEVAEHAYKRMMAGDVVTVHKLKNKMMASMYRFLPRQTVTALMGEGYLPKGDKDRDGHSETHGYVDRNAGEKPTDKQDHEQEGGMLAGGPAQTSYKQRNTASENMDPDRDLYAARGRYTNEATSSNSPSGALTNQGMGNDFNSTNVEDTGGSSFSESNYQEQSVRNTTADERNEMGSAGSAGTNSGSTSGMSNEEEEGVNTRTPSSIRNMGYGNESAAGTYDAHRGQDPSFNQGQDVDDEGTRLGEQYSRT